jgi:ABC-type nitrate/sulfonate/bicarbonate transport system permease component
VIDGITGGVLGFALRRFSRHGGRGFFHHFGFHSLWHGGVWAIILWLLVIAAVVFAAVRFFTRRRSRSTWRGPTDGF